MAIAIAGFSLPIVNAENLLYRYIIIATNNITVAITNISYPAEVTVEKDVIMMMNTQ